MAKNAPKTNALGMNLDPESFDAPEKVERVEEVVPTVRVSRLKKEKAAAGAYTFYLKDSNVERLRAMAEKEGVSPSKLLDHILSEVVI